MSQTRAEASQTNGRRSAGPKTPAGKARASKNAVRHGLNAAAPDPSSDRPEVLRLAAQLCGRADPGFAARNAAEAELFLLRIRTIKRDTLEAAISRVQTGVVQDQCPDSEGVMARALAECADALLKLDGYERKARSRRKKAFRALWE
jgi:hypothetical protein